MSLRDRFRSAPPPAPEPVVFLGETVYVRRLKARTIVQLAQGQDDDGLGIVLTLAVASVVDAEGQPVFEAGDEAWLAEKTMAELAPLLEAVKAANDMGEKAAEEARKNSSPTPS